MKQAPKPKSTSVHHPPKIASKKVFDVRRPGKALASPTSRPVFTGPPVKDSLLVTTPKSRPRLASDPNDKRELMDGSKKVTLQPVATATTVAPPKAAEVPDLPVLDLPKELFEGDKDWPLPKKPSVAARGSNDEQSNPAPQTATASEVSAALAQPAEAATSLQPDASQQLDKTPHASPASTPGAPLSASASVSTSAPSTPPPAAPVSALAPAATPTAAAPIPLTSVVEMPPSASQTSAAPQASADDHILATTAPPDVDMTRAVISTNVAPPKRLWRDMLIVIGLLLFVVAMLNILLDTGILNIQGVPHTHLFTR